METTTTVDNIVAAPNNNNRNRFDNLINRYRTRVSQVAQLQQVQNHTDASLQEQVRLMNKELENLKKLVNK